MAKTEKLAASKGAPPEAGANESVKPKSKKPLLIGIGVLVLGIAGGAGWYFTRGNSHGDAAKKAPAAKMVQPKFIPLETFTVNLQREEGEQFLQVGITLKITDPALEEKIKGIMPEIRSRLLMLLSGKRASELAPVVGKKKLAQEIIAEINGALGLKGALAKSPARKTDAASAVPAATAHPASAPAASAPAASAPAASAPAASAPAAPSPADEAAEEAAAAESEAGEAGGIQDVLFTSFIIQ